MHGRFFNLFVFFVFHVLVAIMRVCHRHGDTYLYHIMRELISCFQRLTDYFPPFLRRPTSYRGIDSDEEEEKEQKEEHEEELVQESQVCGRLRRVFNPFGSQFTKSAHDSNENMARATLH